MEEVNPSQPLTLEQAQADIQTRLTTQQKTKEVIRLRAEILKGADFHLIQEEVNRLVPMQEIFH